MSKLRFVHASDLHLDSPFTGLKSIKADVSQQLCEATFQAYNKIIDLCLQERVDALLLAGDVYDGADRSLRAQLKLVDGLKRLDDAGIRSFICYGNHDPLSGWEARLEFPMRCHRFGPEVEAVPLDPNEPGKATVCGVSYPKRDVRDNLALQFEGVRPNSSFAIGLLHCNVGGNRDHESYAPCTVDDLANVDIDYWALGHVHTRQVAREQSPAVVYPGNPQGRNPKETGPHGVYLVEVSDSGTVNLDFRPMDCVRWEYAEPSIDDLEGEQGLLDRVNERVEELLSGVEGRHLVYRLQIGGRGPLHHVVQQTGFKEDLQDQINDVWSGRMPFAWCERVQVATSPPFNRDQRIKAGDFVGDLLRYIDEARTDKTKLIELGDQLKELYSHARAKRYLSEAAPTEAEFRQWIAEAEIKCLDQLVTDDES